MATGEEVIKFWKVMVQGQVGGAGMRSTERLSNLSMKQRDIKTDSFIFSERTTLRSLYAIADPSVVCL